MSPWINELGNGSENFDLNSIDGLMDAFGDGAGWTVSVVADDDDNTVLASVELPLLTLDSVNTTTGEITGQAGPLPLVIDVNTSGFDRWDGTRFEVTSSPWTWPSDVAERNITAMWNSMAGERPRPSAELRLAVVHVLAQLRRDDGHLQPQPELVRRGPARCPWSVPHGHRDDHRRRSEQRVRPGAH